MWRGVAAAIAGIVLSGLVMMVMETFGHAIFPLPADLDPTDPDQLRAAMTAGRIPTGALVSVLVGWAVSSFLGGLAAGYVAERGWIAPLLVGAFLMLGGVAQFLMIPHPTWMIVGGTLCFIPLALAGGAVGQRVSGWDPEPGPEVE
ncbi:MAG: hypothetical protein H6732_16500 [Alphaproteobacteria bacterium]|nr:hypothetical protein [Alphaproteobacteria bacterium]